ncbi:MAG TPA: T9SS type A sorting domain-containing protein [Niastella sp.]
MKLLFFFSCVLFAHKSSAQILKLTAGTDMTIVGGTVFKTESLTLTPSVNYTLSDNTLTMSGTLIHPASNPHITSVYQYTNNTNPFSGSLQINYTDGAELNGIAEGDLTLNIYNGTSWTNYPVATRDATNNFILTTGLSGVVLNEITLAGLLNPLPLVWRSFSAAKQNQTALLQWATAQEQNTRDFEVQHSSNGINWIGIGVLPAAGNSNIASRYSYVHATPVTGINYYRILQTDMDRRNSYSNLRILQFTAADKLFSITANPVTNNVLTVQLTTTAVLALYTTDGKLVWQQQLNTGTKYIDVSRYAKGVYLFKVNSTAQKVVIQ